MTPLSTIYFLWIAWVASWLVASRWSGPTVKRSRGLFEEVGYRVVTFLGGVLLLAAFSPRRFLAQPVWDTGDVAGWFLAGFVAVGFLFAWWARIHLGRLWSSGVTKKVDHHVVDTGPYGVVRHPIYSGLILSAAATAIAKGTALALLGAALLVLGFYFRARIEERFLRAELGSDAYDAYARCVPMLVPLFG